MTDNTWWVAALTGGTAVLASWVTTLGNARTARIQGQAAAETQRRQQLRDGRRRAYLDLVEQAHRMAELYWKVSAASRVEDAAERAAAWSALYERERDEYAGIRRCVRVVDLEGPPEVAEAAEALKREVGSFHRPFTTMVEGDGSAVEEAVAEFDGRYRPFWAALNRFVDTAREALHST
ncbi:hypothetical protein GCM10010405_40970 [Streptomyces macrosporus]|uniref:Secreted protein n=1 Tax=Streptomyces macrosporus TaxID=44032 RepID=A0ABN3K9M0_9ACTN